EQVSTDGIAGEVADTCGRAGGATRRCCCGCEATARWRVVAEAEITITHRRGEERTRVKDGGVVVALEFRTGGEEGPGLVDVVDPRNKDGAVKSETVDIEMG